VLLAGALLVLSSGPDDVKITVRNATEERVGLLLNSPIQSDPIYVDPGATQTFERREDKDLYVMLRDAQTFDPVDSTTRIDAGELPNGDFTIRVSGPPIAIAFEE
jgi:hypothetical protein